MKYHFRKSIKKEIAAHMAVGLPQFEPLDVQDGLLYRFCHEKGVWFFIKFQISNQSREAFTVELARSPHSCWPETAVLSIPVDIPERGLIRAKPESGVFRFRIGFLFPPHKDYWWELTPMESLEAIMNRFAIPGAVPDSSDSGSDKPGKMSSLVRDALDKICSYAIPYLNGLGKGG